VSKQISITPAGPEHEQGWRELWAIYCGDGIAETVTTATWQRILDPGSSIGAYIAVDNGNVVGFVTFVEHEGTWETKPLCYVEDLYVTKLYRGDKTGIGHSLAAVLLARLRSGEWSRVYGITRTDNVVAQRLYRGFATGEPYLRYVVRGGE